MNAAQAKRLISVSRKALALLNPEWSIFSELQAALEFASAAAAPGARRSSKIPRGCQAGAIPYTADQWALVTHKVFGGVCGGSFFNCECKDVAYKIGLGGGEFNITVKARELGLLDALPTAEGLDTCACGHDSGAHKRDELENLLACEASGCDCDHFHYAHREHRDEQAAA